MGHVGRSGLCQNGGTVLSQQIACKYEHRYKSLLGYKVYQSRIQRFACKTGVVEVAILSNSSAERCNKTTQTLRNKITQIILLFLVNVR